MEPTPYRSHHQLEERVREVTAEGPSHLEVSFADAPSRLTATEITAVLEVITYLHDLALSKEAPDLLIAEIPEFRHPRRSLRTLPDTALRIQSIQYGSPFTVEFVVAAPFAVPILIAFLRQTGATVRTLRQEQGETEREKIRQDGETEREKIRQDGETEREKIEHEESRRPAASADSEVPPSLRPSASRATSRSGGDALSPMSPTAPVTVEERARGPQQLLKAIMNRSTRGKPTRDQ